MFLIQNFPLANFDSEVKLMFFIPQSVLYNPFSTPAPATSDLDMLGLRPDKNENLTNTFVISVTDNA